MECSLSALGVAGGDSEVVVYRRYREIERGRDLRHLLALIIELVDLLRL
jgi:hypothetical protein